MNKKFTLLTVILIGCFITALILFSKTDQKVSPVREAKAEIAGMGYSDLQRDQDFQKAVKYIVENCKVSGYIKGDYLTGASISCD